MTDTPETPVEDDAERPDFARGLAYLKKQIKTLPHQPGVYRMFNAAGDS